MLLLLQKPHGMELPKRLIEREISTRFHCRKVHFDKYLPLNQAAALLNIHPDYLMAKMQDSNTYHGIMYTDQCWVHPDGVYRKIKRKMKDLIKRELLTGIPRTDA